MRKNCGHWKKSTRNGILRTKANNNKVKQNHGAVKTRWRVAMTHRKYEFLVLVVLTPGKNVQRDNVHNYGEGGEGVVECRASKKPRELS